MVLVHFKITNYKLIKFIHTYIKPLLLCKFLASFGFEWDFVFMFVVGLSFETRVPLKLLLIHGSVEKLLMHYIRRFPLVSLQYPAILVHWIVSSNLRLQKHW